MANLSLSRKKDALWTIATSGISALLQLTQLVVAARFLDLHAFGVLAILNVVIWIVLAFQDMGLSSYCVHIGDAGRTQHSTLFWISFGMGATGGLIVLGSSYPLAMFYGLPELKDLLPLVGVNFLLVGMTSQYQANYVRCFKAKLVAQLELGARVFGFLMTVGLLSSTSIGVASIVFGLIAFSVLKLLLMILLAESSWHPLFKFEMAIARKAIGYGIYQAGSQIVNQIRTQADQIIIGKALGPEGLGVYSLAKEIISYPLRFAQPLFSRLLLPALAIRQTDMKSLEKAFSVSLKRTAIVSSLTYGVIAIFATWIVGVMYGDDFLVVSSLIPLLTVFGALRPLGLNIGMLAQATGKTGHEFRWNVVALFISLPVLIGCAAFWPTAMGFAAAVSALQLALTLLSYPFFVQPLYPIGAISYIRSWIFPSLLLGISSLVAFVYPLPSLMDLLNLINW